VERVLNVLDGAVLVISAVEGVQAQTRILMRTLHRLRVPTLLFVNKIDRAGAGSGRVLDEISAKLTPAVVAMGSAGDLGTRAARFTPYGPEDAFFSARLVELLADHDDALMAAFVDGRTVLYGRLRSELAAQTKRTLVHPVFFGSAVTGAGVDSLMRGITTLLPAGEGDQQRPVSGTVFKVERGPAGEKVAYVRLFSGVVKTRDRLRFRGEDDSKVTAISVFERGSAVRCGSVAAGQIGKLWGLTDVQIGDAVGESRGNGGHHFAPPTLETVVVPRRASERGALHLALAQLAEQDPLINLRQDDLRHELFVSLYGEVQKEVIQATLADEYGLEADFRETTTICIERPVGSGEAVEHLKGDDNPFLAGLGLRVEPGSGVEFRFEIELGSLPLAFRRAAEETVRATLSQGLRGWEVRDCVVTMTHSAYCPRQSHAHQGFDKSMSTTAGDFRNLTPLVVMGALKRAGTRVFEPIHRFRLELPADTFGATVPALVRLRAVPQTQELRGPSYVVEGDIPAARVHELRLQLPGLTRGEGVVECAFDRYEPVAAGSPPPTRPRTDFDPLDREQYLLRVMRRI
jgi:ribosomal protection tetracycline resistance protein